MARSICRPFYISLVSFNPLSLYFLHTCSSSSHSDPSLSLLLAPPNHALASFVFSPKAIIHIPQQAPCPQGSSPPIWTVLPRALLLTHGNGCHAMPTGRCLSWDSHRRSWDRLCCSGSPTCLCAPSGVQRLGAFTQCTAEQIPSPQLVLNKWELPAVNSFRFML